MCFEKITRAESIESAQYSTEISVGKMFSGQPPKTREENRHSIMTAANIWLVNQIVTAALASAEGVDSVELGVEGRERLVGPLPDRSVVISSAMGGYFLEEIHPDIVIKTAHVKMDNKILVFQLEDFSFVAEYSVTFHDKDSLEEDIAEKATIEANLNFDYESCQVYHFKKPTFR